MKTLKSLLSVIAIVVAMVFTTACNKSQDKTTNNPVQTENAAMEIDALLNDAETLAGKEVFVEGVCTHICKHGGAKIFLMGSDDTKTIRVEPLGAFAFAGVDN